MTENTQRRRRGSFSSLLVPLAALTCAVAAALARGPAAPEQRQAIGFAAAVCVAGIVGAWAVAVVQPLAPAARVAASLASGAIRLLPALAALAWLQATTGSLVQSGAAGYLAAFYLTALAADVIRIIMMRSEGLRRRGGSDVI